MTIIKYRLVSQDSNCAQVKNLAYFSTSTERSLNQFLCKAATEQNICPSTYQSLLLPSNPKIPLHLKGIITIMVEKLLQEGNVLKSLSCTTSTLHAFICKATVSLKEYSVSKPSVGQSKRNRKCCYKKYNTSFEAPK